MAQSYSVSLDTIVREHNLAIVNRAVDYDRVQITTWEVSRPGLPLAGFYDYFDATRVQIIGKLEITYLMDMPRRAAAALRGSSPPGSASASSRTAWISRPRCSPRRSAIR